MDDAKSRLRRIVGDEGIARLDAANVAVFGLGGVGSSCAEALVRGGVGNVLLIDKDAVEPSNINRQAIAFVSTIGRRKVDVMRDMALDINPDVRVEVLDAFVNAENLDELMSEYEKPDIIVDAIDTLTVKVALALYAQENEMPIISAMGGANKTDPTKLEFSKLTKTHVCPLCREMRKIARDRGLEDLDVLFSPERPVKRSVESRPDRRERSELGTMSYMPPIMGQMLASWVINHLLEGLKER
ncbi:MAG: tRNA threonylcarbamoyladenosine dehydratase [Eggerthellaceae bacterium]|nr:tRNA threonylcarbamoyladenosine dehydratase [Eggerthellaceae bacterium]